jgi:hypothetical protein
MTVKEALQAIVDNKDSKALNYAVNYASYGLSITDERELRVQVLYVLNNITAWRGETAKEVRKTLKQFCGG